MSRFALWLWSLILHVPRLLYSLVPKRKPRLYRAVRVEDLPEGPEPYRVYIAGENNHVWGAAMVCPCGCRSVIQLNLLRQVQPRWSIQEHKDGSVSVTPSVWRQKDCRSHFVLHHGRVRWC
jgi:hypothetical protein